MQSVLSTQEALSNLQQKSPCVRQMMLLPSPGTQGGVFHAAQVEEALQETALLALAHSAAMAGACDFSRLAAAATQLPPVPALAAPGRAAAVEALAALAAARRLPRGCVAAAAADWALAQMRCAALPLHPALPALLEALARGSLLPAEVRSSWCRVAGPGKRCASNKVARSGGSL